MSNLSLFTTEFIHNTQYFNTDLYILIRYLVTTTSSILIRHFDTTTSSTVIRYLSRVV